MTDRDALDQDGVRDKSNLRLALILGLAALAFYVVFLMMGGLK